MEIAASILTLLGLAGLAWLVWRRSVLRPLRRMAIALTALAHGRAGSANIPPSPSPPLNQAVALLVGRLAAARQERDGAVSAATRAVEQQSARLAALLHELREGVVVCNLRHQIVLYNQVALTLLRVSGEIGLGRPLFALMAIEPLQHCLDLLQRRSDRASANLPFISRTLDGSGLLQGRVSLVLSDGVPSGYVLSFDDVIAQLSALAQRDALLRELLDVLRQPGPPQQRLAAAIEHASRGYQTLLTGWWPMSDLHSVPLFDLVAARLAATTFTMTVVGLPLWLHGDGHLLVLTLDALLRALAADCGATCFDLSAQNDHELCWISVSWVGPPLAAAALDAWQKLTLSPALGGLTVKDVLLHHAREQPLQEEQNGRCVLRLAVQSARQVPSDTVMEPSSRPEFFDFNLLEQSQGGQLAALGLRNLTFVVFDSETTGLEPGEGDRMVALAGVRIVGGRILTGESFNRFINPGRPIPAESSRIHGITDKMVEGKPPLAVVLPQFKAFVGDDVLVAHNAAFDLKFLRMFETDYGVSFDNAVLDTMLLSSFLDGTAEHQSLDEVCHRYGISITERHTALGDALAAAAVLLPMLEALEAKGVRTLGEALSTLNMTWELHQRSRAV